MKGRSRSGAAAAALACALAGCVQGETSAGDPRDAVNAAQLAVKRSGDCAADLDHAAGEDPAAVARALGIEPIRLVPHGGPASAPVREEIAERLAGARADAAAASSLARCAEDPAGEANAGRRAMRSLAASADLCRAADRVQHDRIARATSGADSGP
jgi:hypothetical protein